MSLLSYDELCVLVAKGVIENCSAELINGASIDVTLANAILVERQPRLHVRQLIDYSRRDRPHLFEEHLNGGGYTLAPGEFVLAATQQVFNLPLDIAAHYTLKSSMARCGLNHLNSGWCDPGWHGSALTLEMVNVTRYHHIVLHAGDKIGQMLFYRVTPVPEEASYKARGRYNGDSGLPTPETPPRREH
jgi:dCTP deaminase